MKKTVFLSLIFLLWFQPSSFSFWGTIEDNFFHLPNWKDYQSKNFIIHYFDGSYAQKDLQILEKTLEKGLIKICLLLDIHPFTFKPYLQEKIPVYFYPDKKTKRTLTHNSRNGHLIDFRIHLIYNNELKRDPLIELTEWVIEKVWGNQELDFMKEGLKYAGTGVFFEIPIHTWAYYYAKNKKIDIQYLSVNRNFRNDNGFYSIPLSASFLLFLLENKDLSLLPQTRGGGLNSKLRIKTLYLSKRRNFKREFENIYGRKLKDIEKLYREFLMGLNHQQKDLSEIEKILNKVKDLKAWKKNQW